MKIRDVIKIIKQYKHPVKKGRVTIAGHPSDDIDKGTLNSVLKQASLKERRERD